MRNPSAETMAQHRAAAVRGRGSEAPLFARRTMRAISEWFHRGQLAGESSTVAETGRYTGGRI